MKVSNNFMKDGFRAAALFQFLAIMPLSIVL
jgi:hypothetical protein